MSNDGTSRGTLVRGLDAGLAAIQARLGNGVAVVGVCGPVGAGKSTLARMLSPCIVATDDYLPDYDGVPEAERDDPRHADLPAVLAAHLRQLAAGRPATVPVWSFQTHSRVSERTIESHPTIVCEGIHALHPVVAPVLSLKVFIDAPAGDRWRRWELIEESGERGWGVEKARAYFDSVAEPTFARWADRYRASADLIVLNGG